MYLPLPLLLLLVSVVASDVTVDQINQIKAELITMFDENRAEDMKHFPLAHKCVRLSFHDCVGRCDGCLNIANPDNAGLAGTVQTLETFYNRPGVVDGGSVADLQPKFGRADMWALAGGTALEFLSKCPKKPEDKRCPGFDVPFRYGRQDCTAPDAPYTDEQHTFPNAHGGYADTTKFFKDNFDFTARESVAILGAHTIGRCVPGNSGFRGKWVMKWDEVNNAYYKDLVDASLNWKQKNVRKANKPPRWQWNNKNGFIMLNIDMSLVKDIQVDTPDPGQSSCEYGTCADSGGRSVTEEYAASNDIWIKDFIATFVKMVETIKAGTLTSAVPGTVARGMEQEVQEALLVKLLVKDLVGKRHDAN